MFLIISSFLEIFKSKQTRNIITYCFLSTLLQSRFFLIMILVIKHSFFHSLFERFKIEYFTLLCSKKNLNFWMKKKLAWIFFKDFFLICQKLFDYSRLDIWLFPVHIEFFLNWFFFFFSRRKLNHTKYFLINYILKYALFQ